MRAIYIPMALTGLLGLLVPAPVFALPDATITQLRVEGRDYRGGDLVPLDVTVSNRGDGTLPPVPVVLAIDEEPYAEWHTPSPAGPGDSVVWSVQWQAARGSHVMLVTVDPLNDVAESNEANNSAFISLGVAQEAEPSPWPAALVGLGAFLVGGALTFFIQRARLRAGSGRSAHAARRSGKANPAGRR
jgi:hypothetical protein